MGGSPSSPRTNASSKNLDGRSSYLGVHTINIFVRDQERSVRFYVDQLGFNLAFDGAAFTFLFLRHRAPQELEIAKQVQARLFPQTLPPIRTVEYAGTCIQARQVGGDYYDFLDFGGDRFGIVVGDIAGKGMAAALLMANLQANLRMQCAMASDHPQRLLRSVNQVFYENSTDSAYATLFFAEYDDDRKRKLWPPPGTSLPER